MPVFIVHGIKTAQWLDKNGEEEFNSYPICLSELCCQEKIVISMRLTDVVPWQYLYRSRIRKGMMCKIDEFVTFMKLLSHEFQAPKNYKNRI